MATEGAFRGNQETPRACRAASDLAFASGGQQLPFSARIPDVDERTEYEDHDQHRGTNFPFRQPEYRIDHDVNQVYRRDHNESDEGETAGAREPAPQTYGTEHGAEHRVVGRRPGESP